MGKTLIWVQGSVLAEALGKVKKVLKKESMDLDRSGGKWNFTLCEVVQGNFDSEVLNIKVFDEGSEFHGDSVTIPSELTKADKNGVAKVVMVNEWAAAEVSGDTSLGVPPDDLITLTHLHEPSVVYCLRRRYEQNMIYTATGPILIALNPFKALPGMYDDLMMNEHWMAGEGVAHLDLKPHIYQNAHAAFRSMMQGIEMKSTGNEDAVVDQSMLISGESGAGKTVTTRHVMKYLASLSQRKAKFSKQRRDASPGGSASREARRSMSMRVSRAQSWKAGAVVEERILESNPILEAFGNARTLRNDNSSRFGKFIELQFKQTGSLIGASIETYLLEKVRLVHQSEGERNFHIFYELLASAMDEEREMFMLGDYTVKDFKMTNMSGTYDRRDGEDDLDLFDELVFSMGTMGFEKETQDDIFCCIAGFLHAFNLSFTAPTDECSKVDESNPHLDATLKMLGLDKDAFNSAMTEYDIEIGKQIFTKQFTVEGAQKALEAFVKGTYGAMFSFIVSTVNKKIDYKPAGGEPKLHVKAGSISVLDIFGFESFQLNSFEQLCINYCNEALQQQFNLFVFKNEQELYKKEGIAWDFVEFPDNHEVLELIDKKGTGILSILSDQCRAPRTTDATFLDAIYKTCGDHERFVGSALHKGRGQFIIAHYAGAVAYESESFLEKNKDETPRGASALLESSSKSLVRLLGKITLGDNAAPNAAPKGRSSKKAPSVGSQFAMQLTELRRRIDQTEPHYIRCLKPNQSLMPEDFDNAMVADQLRYAGVLEAIRVSRVGYSQRYSHANFLGRYSFIALKAVKLARDDEKVDILVVEIAKKVWEQLNPNKAPPADVKDAAGIQKGETKVFLRQYAFDSVQKLRAKVMTTSSVKIQAAARRFIFRCRYARTLRFAVKVQAWARRFLARKIMIRFRENKFATVVQAFVRWSLARLRFVARKAAALLVQSIFRGYIARKSYKLLYEKFKEEEKKKKFATVVQVQSIIRGYIARKNYKLLYEKLKEEEKKNESAIYEKLKEEEKKNESAIYEKLEEEEKKNNSAIFIQCMYRISVARQRSSRIQALKELKAKSKKAQLEGKAQQSNGNLNRTVQSQRYMELKAAKSKKAALEGKAQQSNGNLNRTVSSQRYKEVKAAKAKKAQKLEEKPQQPKGKLNSNSRSLLGL